MIYLKKFNESSEDGFTNWLSQQKPVDGLKFIAYFSNVLIKIL